MATAWDKLDTVGPEDDRTQKARLHGDFEGTLSELTAWMTATFKEPNEHRLFVSIGKPPVVQIQVHEPEPEFPYALISAFHQGSPHAYAEGRDAPVLREAVKQVTGGNKIQAIKAIREATRMGLKEAKDFVEGPLATFMQTKAPK